MKEKLKNHDFNPKDKKDFKIKMLGKKILTQQSQGVVKTSRLSKCSSKLMNSLKPL